jgi:nitroreductase
MVEITIDENLCHKDGLCAMACTYGIFVQEEKDTVPKIDEVMLEKCYRCGHCVAICPHGAISHSHYSDESVNPITLENLPSYDQVLELMRSRRSKRLFKDTPVEKDVLEKVIEAARFAPSQHNEQSTEFIVIQDRKLIHKITALTAEGIGKLAGYAKNPIARMMMRRALGRRGAETVFKLAPEMEGLVSLFKSGTDWILRDAPVLILFCADSAGGSFAGVNANLALHNAALAAETVGLGCFYEGFVVTTAERDDRIASLVSLPETHMIYGALAIGYPRLKFKKWPERNPAKVTWM